MQILPKPDNQSQLFETGVGFSNKDNMKITVGSLRVTKPPVLGQSKGLPVKWRNAPQKILDVWRSLPRSLLSQKCLSFSLICSCWEAEFLIGYTFTDHRFRIKMCTLQLHGPGDCFLFGKQDSGLVHVQMEVNLIADSSTVYLLKQAVIVILKGALISWIKKVEFAISRHISKWAVLSPCATWA